MKCPKCEASELEKQRFLYDESVELDVCPSCKGMWFDKGELDRLDESVTLSVEDEAFEEVDLPPRTCPSCGGELRSYNHEAMRALVVEICDSCEGFWLDEHELEDIREMTLKLESEDADHIIDVSTRKKAGHAGLMLALINFGYSLPR